MGGGGPPDSDASRRWATPVGFLGSSPFWAKGREWAVGQWSRVLF